MHMPDEAYPRRAAIVTERRWFWPLLILALALLPRLVLWQIADHPGLWDPTEYYNLAVNLHDGRGCNLDSIWNFATKPDAVTHPIDHWLPLPGIVAAGSFALFGVSVQAALLPFVLLGALQAILVYAFAGQIGTSRFVQVFAALATAYTPWLFLSSLHSDTTTLFGVLAFGALVSVYEGVTGSGRWLWLGGLLTGLAMLTRNDALMLIPAGGLAALWLTWRGVGRIPWRDVAIGGVLLAVVLVPWLMRNQSALGTPWPGSTVQSMFVTGHEDFYAYSKEISAHTYLGQGLGTILAKIAFELAASVKLMITLVELIFPVAILGGLLDALWPHPIMNAQADQQSEQQPDTANSRIDLRPHLAALLFVLLTWGAYGMLMPYLRQGGSFKEAHLAMVPFLLIIGAQAVERVVRPRRALLVVAGLTLALLLANAVELTRADFKTNDGQAAIYEDVRDALDTLQAASEREIIVMTRDPWSVNLITGYRAVMVPNESLDVILEVADRYGVTHLLAPVPRDAISAIDRGETSSPRLSRVMEFPQHDKHLYAIIPAANSAD